MDDQVSIFAVGDVFVDIEDGPSAFHHVRELFDQADIVVGNCEGVYSDRPSAPPTVRHAMTAGRSRANGLGAVPFHVMTCANNHILDGGYDGLADTLETLEAQGIATTGAGAGIHEALRPAVIERKAVRIAFLAVSSVFPVGYEARGERPGLAAIRVRTFYSAPDPTFWEPGVPPIITTMPVQEDLDRLGEAILAARTRADIVIVSCHWGNSSLYEVVQDYERRTARIVVDLGADAVLCHHHHSLRGIEFYRGQPIFYGLGAFVHHFSHFNPSEAHLISSRRVYGDHAHGPREGFPLFPFHPDARLTGIATITARRGGIVGLGFIPAVVLPDGCTKPCLADSPQAAQVIGYFRRLTAGLGSSVIITEARRGDRACLELNNGV
jgi:poly-gamma-glutamate synthesis protein (capsule biosynthesis protein)